ncbi:MAG TPA: aldo/keto reductase [Bryobacteraceae bacterium]|nr:aldo/keto reductase [Bryobacteraceae bacterium]HPT28184.1 aldo/keto reductase [Bryobacteraceae bacterium]
MNKRTLGRTGLEVSEIGYGAWGLGGNQWRGHKEDDALAALRHALENGLNFIDSALAYNDGHSEQLIARTLKETGAKAYVSTKVPPKNKQWPALPGIGIENVFPYRYVVKCTETSLRNLDTEQIDLQQFHVWNPEWIASDEWRRAIEDLKQSGKVRFFGISINDHQPDSAIEAIKTGLIDTVQVIFNIYDQSPERNLLPLCEQLNIGVLARCPLDEGALTGAITPDTEFDPAEFRAFYFRGDRKLEVFARANSLKADLEASGVAEPLATTALRFTLTPKAVSTVIPGMRKIRNVEANLAVSALGPISGSVMEVLRRHAWDKNYYS